jgi:hypothetical protein
MGNKKVYAICPECRQMMVPVMIVAGDQVFQGYLCDCKPQPAGVAADVLQARCQETTLTYDIELEDANDAG